MPLDLELSGDFLNFRQDLCDDTENSCELQVVEVLGHDCGQETFVIPHAELIVDLTGNKFACVSDLAQFHRKGAGSVTESGSKFATTQHFILRVEVLKSRNHPKQRNVLSTGK